MTRFWWVRHGPTHARAMIGWTDLAADLSDRAAIARLSALLPEPAVILSSDLARARATADAPAAPQRRRLPHDPGLREIHFGAWEQRSFAEVEAESPGHIRAFWETPGEVRPPGGESWNALRHRTQAAVDRLAAAHAGGEIIVVAHFGTILAALQHATGMATTEAFGHRIENLSVTTLTHDHGAWGVQAINHIA